MACQKCGEEHSGCVAHARSGRPCGNRAMSYQTVCRMHGGSQKSARAKADRARAEEEAKRQATILGLPRDVSPSEALLEEIRWSAGHVDWLRGKVQEIEDVRDLVWGATKAELVMGTDKDKHTSLEHETLESGASIWYELYDRERKHLVTVCAAALRAGVEERRVRLAENQGMAVAGAIQRILELLQLTDEQRAKVPDIVPAQLRLLAGGAA